MNSDSKKNNDMTEYENHGDNLSCIMDSDSTEELSQIITHSIQDADLYAQTETDFYTDKLLHSKVFMLEYPKAANSKISVRNILAVTNMGNELLSIYPVVRAGNTIPIRITNIIEWSNKLEAWIAGDIALKGEDGEEDGRSIEFFDADYVLHKGEYKIGEVYNFCIGALAYVVKENNRKEFSLEGKDATDFRAKIGQDDEYDENGVVKPVTFFLDQCCAIMQYDTYAPDEAEFLSTVEKVDTIQCFEKDFYYFDILLKETSIDEPVARIPCFVRKCDKNAHITSAKQLQGLIWIAGYKVG